jgi:hypothetical protein
MKKFAIWFGLQDVGILYSRAVIQRTTQLMSLPHFWSTVWQKRSRSEHMQTSRRLDLFLHEAAQNFELLSNIQDQEKTTYSG